MQINNHLNLTKQILRLNQVKIITGLSRSTIYDKQNPKSPRYDESFPVRIRLGARAVGWLRSDVDTWLDSMINQSISEGEHN